MSERWATCRLEKTKPDSRGEAGGWGGGEREGGGEGAELEGAGSGLMVVVSDMCGRGCSG